ncbi:DUF1508 domain-containing protein [Corallincola platygyrae]|uniref:DUF1508 domain-containing protein n=1 Tax=Corallincola platygyrae TaxID=1193278 RepID=A0ABW4XQS8_9GAMM
MTDTSALGAFNAIIPKADLNGSQDPIYLYNQGISQIISLSSELWSDYNRHDPGITMLEVLSYLLTELSYRLDWPVQDILVDGIADSDSASRESLMAAHFPPADEVLPAAALTERDYRKLLVDLPNIQNAWLAPLPVQLYLDCKTGEVTRKARNGKNIKKLSVAGGYQVSLELADGLNAQAKAETVAAAETLLHQQRNLCEWFTKPRLISKQAFILCGEIEIAPKADAKQVFADVMQAVHQHLQAPITSQPPELSLNSVDWADALFNGPLLDHGYISDQAIGQAELKKEIRLSDLINLIMDIDDVVAVRELIINPDGQTQPLKNVWVVPVMPGRKAVLKPQSGHLAFFKHQMPAFYDKAQAIALLKAQLKQSQAQQEQAVSYQLQATPGQNRQISAYQTIQTDMPAVYGLSEAGLPGDASEQRKAQVLQLRGYLAFFDQLAANYLAQTSHLRDLLSLDDQQQTSYFGQLPETIRDWQKLYGDKATAAPMLQSLLNNSDSDLDRRNRFLDFLAARFGEDLTGLTDVMLNAFGHSPVATLRYKSEFHQAVPNVSRNRGLGHDVSLKNAYWNTENVSGLEQRLCRLLGITNHQRRNLGDVAFDIYAEIDETPDDEFRFRIRNRDNDTILLSSSTRYETKRAAKREMRQAILMGMMPSHYRLAQSRDGRHYFNLVDDSEEIIARRIEYFDSEAAALEAIDEVVTYLSINYSDEGMYLIEHSLLLPATDDEPHMPICLDDGCDDCIDPYSYQLHVVLPAYGARFASMDFRRYCESVIRSEVPAHIMPRVCWIDKDQMAMLEKAYKDWLGVLHGASRSNPEQKKQRFIDVLGQLNNVYPVEQLHDCESEQTGFVLGRTALGTFKESL